jgi:hypothetical protein
MQHLRKDQPMNQSDDALCQLIAVHDQQILRSFTIPPAQFAEAARRRLRLGEPPESVRIEEHDWLITYTASWTDGFTYCLPRARERPPPKAKPQRRMWGIFVRIR